MVLSILFLGGTRHFWASKRGVHYFSLMYTDESKIDFDLIGIKRHRRVNSSVQHEVGKFLGNKPSQKCRI